MNKIEAMFDLDKCKKLIQECPENEIVILCAHWSINQPAYEETEEGSPGEQYQWDWEEFEEKLDTTLYHSDYDDLIADPHGIYNS